MQKIESKHAAHAAAWNKTGAASQAAFRAANIAAKAAVRRYQERYHKQQTEYAEAAFRGGNVGVFHKHVQRIFGEQQGSKSEVHALQVLTFDLPQLGKTHASSTGKPWITTATVLPVAFTQ